MTSPTGAVTYAGLLRTPGAARAFTSASLSRLSYGTVGLSLLLTVQGATGSYAAAGAALGAFGLPALVNPWKARAIDRHGRRAVLLPLAAAYAAVLLALAVLGAQSVARPAPYLALAVAAGLLTPPVGAVMRAVWAALTPEPQQRQRAYGLDAVVEEGLFVLGPVLVGVVTGLLAAWAALALTAALALAGSWGLGTAPGPAGRTATAAPAGSPRRRALGPLVLPRFRWLLLAAAATSLALGPLEVAVVARTAELGSPAAAAYLLAALSAGSAVGGLTWGRTRRRRPYPQQLLGLLLVLAGGTALAGLAPGLLGLAVVLALTGTALAPVLVVAYLAADGLVPVSVRTEATTWVATALNVGGSLGAAAAGQLVERTSASATLLLAGAVLGLAVPVLAAASARLGRRGC